jgi:hypothetical protein
MTGNVILMSQITREYVRAHRDTVFVFGDNMAGRGFGGQAAAMRGEPNSIGVPTKWKPERSPSSYFCDDDWNDGNVRQVLLEAFARIEKALANGKDVVIPADGLGTGLAELPRRAPKIAAYIEGRIAALQTRERT